MRVYVCAHTDCGPICRSENTVKESWVSGLVGSTFTFAAILPAQDPHIVFGYLFQSSLICIVSLLSFLYLIGEKSHVLFLYSLYLVVSLASSLSLCVTYKMVTNSKGSLNLVKFHTGASKRQSLPLFAKADNILCFPFCDFYVFISTY